MKDRPERADLIQPQNDDVIVANFERWDAYLKAGGDKYTDKDDDDA